MDHVEKAKQLFVSGCSCSQAVFLAWRDELGLDGETMTKLASGLGGGVGGLRETCGAVSAMALVLGLLEGSADPTDKAAKAALYQRIQELGQRFKAENGSFNCRELLKLGANWTPTAPADRTDEYYRARPCIRLVESAARLLEEALAQKA